MSSVSVNPQQKRSCFFIQTMTGGRMMNISWLSLSFFFIGLQLYAGDCAVDDGNIITTTTNSVFSRSDFPSDFVFGAGTSAYQVEGAAAEDGRKPSIWDTFIHEGRTPYKGTGDIASDQYHMYKDDVKLMDKMGLDAYRFSISWSRLIPDGHGAVNPKGLDYYNNLINELLSYGITAHVTLNHFDIPQALQNEYEGYLSPKFIEDFTAYAEVCFKEYGDRVKSWITFNEPIVQAVLGNDVGLSGPGRCSYPFGVNCSKGDSTREPYLAAHNILLSHAAAVHLYRTKYQTRQKGQIGITILAIGIKPLTNSVQDIAASKRVLNFQIGWFLEPLVYGRYPAIMRKIVGSRLPLFTENDLKLLKGSFDFVGLNHYSDVYVEDFPRPSDKFGSDVVRDLSVKASFTSGLLPRDYTRLEDDGELIKEPGLPKVVEYVKQKYRSPAIFIHENGYAMFGNDSTKAASQNDTERVDYMKRYIKSLLPTIRNGSNIRGYFVWSFVDCFEPAGGYNTYYGLYGVDFSDKNRRRYPRQSAFWYTEFLAKTARKPETI